MPPKKPPSNEVPAVKDEPDEDTPVIKQLKEIDEKYCAIEVELEEEIEKLRQKYDAKQAPLLDERRQVLNNDADCPEEDKAKGTPGCHRFWCQALQNSSEIEECLHDCDDQVLEYLHDITKADLDKDCPQKGIKLAFHFKENPFFTNEVLSMEVEFDYNKETYKPWKETDCIEVKGTTIDWKPGKNITIEKKVKEVKGKAGKKRPGKAKEEPCPSFFRILFTSAKKDDNLPEALECIYNDEEEDEEDLMECHLENIGHLAHFLSEELLPYAVRYYTGEACEDDEDDDEESEEEDGSSDDDDDDDDSEDEPPPKAKGAIKNKPGAKGGDKEKGGEKTEECKQQ